MAICVDPVGVQQGGDMIDRSLLMIDEGAGQRLTVVADHVVITLPGSPDADKPPIAARRAPAGIGRVENRNLFTTLRQRQRGAEAGVSGADHRRFHLQIAFQRRSPARRIRRTRRPIARRRVGRVGGGGVGAAHGRSLGRD